MSKYKTGGTFYLQCFAIISSWEYVIIIQIITPSAQRCFLQYDYDFILISHYIALDNVQLHNGANSLGIHC